jgi:glutathione synthase/RimK-type ligase-like ATP-grasp enzyme
MELVVVGNPGNRRWDLLQEALASHWPGTVRRLAYQTLIEKDLSLVEAIGHAGRDCVVRLESPGGCFQVLQSIIAMGADCDDVTKTERMTSEQVMSFRPVRGLIWLPRQRFLGFRRLLARLSDGFQGTFVNQPDDIICMSDKPDCHTWLEGHGCPVAPSLGEVGSYEELREQMRVQGVERVFVKLRNASSASGVVAYSMVDGEESAWSSAVLDESEGHVVLRNSLQIRQYTSSFEIERLVNSLSWLGGLHVEHWMPKCRVDGHPTDLRVVVVDGEPCHRVLRLGHAPMTNLHLGSERGQIEQLESLVGVSSLERLWETCGDVMKSFPRSLYAGVDVAMVDNGVDSVVIEVNPFGDLIPRILWEGMDTHHYEVSVMADKWGS